MTPASDLIACERLLNEIERAGWKWSLEGKSPRLQTYTVFVHVSGEFPGCSLGEGETLPLALEAAFRKATRSLLDAQLNASRLQLASARPSRTLIAIGAAS